MLFRSPAVVAKISVPTNVSEILKNEPERGPALQADISAQFIKHLSNGLVVTGFERGDVQSSYLLSAEKEDK